MNRSVASFSGSNRLTRAHSALLVPTNSIYICFFARLLSLPGVAILVAKDGGSDTLTYRFFVTLSSIPTWTISNDGLPSDSVPHQVITTNTWYFFEAMASSAQGVMGIDVTRADETELHPFTTEPYTGSIYSGSSPLWVGSGNAGASPMTGQMHSLTILDRPVTDEERYFFFAEGNGRDFWEFDDEHKEYTRAHWALDEPHGTRRDRVNGLDLTDVSNVASESRIIGTSSNCIDSSGPELTRHLLANSYAFRDWVREGWDLASVAEAKESIHINTFEKPVDLGDDAYPCAVIHGHRSTVTGNRHVFPSGSLLIDLLDRVPTDQDNEDRQKAFTNRTGKIRSEIAKLGKQGGYLHVREVAINRPLGISPPTQSARTYSTRFSLDYGLAGGAG